MTRNVFTVDVEEYFCVTAFEKVIPKGAWGDLSSRVDETVPYLIDALDAAGAKGTFFILGWVAERNRTLARRIHDAGHEVASHGYGHERIHCMKPEDFRADVRRGRSILEDQVGGEIRGYRAPSFSVVRETLWALDVLADEGLLYDSSIYPVYRGDYGIHDAPQAIHKIRLPEDREMIEVPPASLSTPMGRIPVGGGAYLRWFPFPFFDWAFRRVVRKEGVPFVFYIHPWEVDLDHPPVAGADRVSRLRHFFGIPRNRRKVERLLASHTFGTALDAVRAKEAEWR